MRYIGELCAYNIYSLKNIYWYIDGHNRIKQNTNHPPT